ncbi:MAG: tetratricopeptide repeat protein, partial [Xanthobacteraceae bacterium]
RGMIETERNNYDAAIADFGEAIKLDPNDATPLIRRAEAKLKPGDSAGAGADIAAAKALQSTGKGPGGSSEVAR